jgi:hypothetical protein
MNEAGKDEIQMKAIHIERTWPFTSGRSRKKATTSAAAAAGGLLLMRQGRLMADHGGLYGAAKPRQTGAKDG